MSAEATVDPSRAGGDLPTRIHAIVARRAVRDPDGPALIEGDVALSNGALMAAIQAMAARLATAGVRAGDRVLIVGENSLVMVAAIFAASVLDAWAVVVNSRLSAPEIDRIKSHCGARRTVYATAASPEAAAHAARHGAAEQDGGILGPFALGPLGDGPDAAAEPVFADPAQQVAAMIYTTGTTGVPKGVMLTHHNILFIADLSGRLRGIGPADRLYAVLPVSHIFGLASALIGSLYHGATIRLVARFAPAAVIESLTRDRISVLQGVPAMFSRLIEYLKLNPDKALEKRFLRYLSVGGSPLDPVLKTEIEALFGCPLHNGYGMTEASPTISQTRIETPPTDCSCGPILPGLEVRFVDRDGRTVPPGTVGELHVRGPNIMKGYYRNPEATAQAIDPDGWLNTGDLARLDGGQLYIAGRSKELIIRSGFNVYPADVEAVLNAHPLITHSAVVGRAVPGNEEVVAFIQPLQGQTIDRAELEDYLVERLAPYKRPCEIIVMENLPASSTGKVLKGQLAASLRGKLPVAD